ncbi:MAG: glycosyltransferase [Gammaproteobacteria bacterium]|nr:glycosyltransferase [Gammaproteobacteria bacterium]
MSAYPFNQPDYAVSVLMPVRNGGAYLYDAVTSILNQQSVELELVIIDDHSTDHACNSLPADRRIKTVSSPGKGIVAALNHGISVAQFPYIARMDADDIAADHRLHTQLKHLIDHPELDICGAKVKIFNESNTIAEGYLHYQTWINGLCQPTEIEREFFVESCIPHPTALLRRELLEALGGYHDSAWPEDYDLWFRALLDGAVFGKPDNPDLLHWRDHQQRLSRVDHRYEKQKFLRCKAHYLSRYLRQKGIEHCHVWGTGPTGLKLHDYLTSSAMPVTGFIDVNAKMRNRRKRGKIVAIAPQEPALFATQCTSIANSIIVVAVSARGARARIREYLTSAGQTESTDFIFAA